ncbi:MAG: type II toxin-antitoxin system RelE/ParE family toxin [Opitutaceae bacterium]|jgi:hypothetical protein
MAIELSLLFPEILSPRFRIYAIGENDSFPVVDFLEDLQQSNEDSYQTLIAVLEYVATQGPIINEKRKSRCVDRKHRIFEFKTKDGNRVLWFYDANSVIICVNGFSKPKPNRLREDIATAVSWKLRYMSARASNQVRIVT